MRDEACIGLLGLRLIDSRGFGARAFIAVDADSDDTPLRRHLRSRPCPVSACDVAQRRSVSVQLKALITRRTARALDGTTQVTWQSPIQRSHGERDGSACHRGTGRRRRDGDIAECAPAARMSQVPTPIAPRGTTNQRRCP